MTEVVDLGFRPRAWQANTFRRLKRFSVLVIHRRGGKTVLAVMRLIDAALRFTQERGRFQYIAPELKQAKAVAWDYVKHYALKVPGTKVNESELWVEFPNEARIRIYGADNPDSLRGIYSDGAAIDEVAQMKPEVWGEIIQPALADRKGWALFIGTPKGVNLFSDLFYRYQADEDWYVVRLTCNDTDALDADELARMKVTMSDSQFRQEMLCDFTASNEDNLITIDLVEDAALRHVREEQYSFAPKVLGVDVAFAEDGDRSVIQPRQGLAAFKPWFGRGVDNMTLADRVARTWDRWQADAVFIDAGRGEGVGSRLVQLGYAPTMISFGGSATNPVYINKRTEMWFEMWHWLKAGGAIPNVADLKQDLCTPLYDTKNAANKFRLERKEDIEARGLPSPDLGDALALTFAHPVAAKLAFGSPVRAGGTVARDYDPYSAV